MNSFGRLFRLSIFGESHGPMIGVVIDGCPAGIRLMAEDFAADLARRKSGAAGTTKRYETDQPRVVSGIFNDHTTGAPLAILFDNHDQQTADYEKQRWVFRPSHADFSAHRKFNGWNDWRGGGAFSGRLTIALVAAGVIAKKIIQPITVNATIKEIGGRSDYDQLLTETIAEGDSLGGIIECRAQNVPCGLGEPFFDSVESLLSHAVFAIPGVKGIEFGAGFESARLKGSTYNDAFINQAGQTATNNAGGINGGITNGNDLIFRIAVHPTASIRKPQQTFDFANNKMTTLNVAGRHDVCFALRLPVIVEAVTACVLADLILIQRAIVHQQEKKI